MYRRFATVESIQSQSTHEEDPLVAGLNVYKSAGGFPSGKLVTTVELNARWQLPNDSCRGRLCDFIR